MKQLTLEEVLAAKEARQERQQALRLRTALPLVSIMLCLSFRKSVDNFVDIVGIPAPNP